MIAARLAGGNLFFGFLGGGITGWGIFGALGAARSTRILLGGFFLGGGGGVFWIESVGKN